MSRRSQSPVEMEDSDQDEFHDVESPGGESHSSGGRRKSKEEIKPETFDGPTNMELGFNVISSMSEEDLDTLMSRLENEAPLIDNISVNLRAKKLNWSAVAFDHYSADACEAAWEYLRSLTRRFRIMSEVVREIKLVTQRDNVKFRARLIESAPGFPKKPPNNGCQMFCKEMWNMNPNKGNNFILFQRECQEKFAAMPKSIQLDWENKCNLLRADHNRQVKEFYANYPHFTHFVKHKKLGTVVLPNSSKKKEKRTAPRTKLSQDSLSIMFSDAPPLPLTPAVEFIQSKLNRLDPPPAADDLPELKKKYREKWTKLSERKKSKWIARTIKRCEEYISEIESFKERNPGFMPKPFRLRSYISKDELAMWEKYNDKPERPPTTSLDLFHQNMIHDPDFCNLSREDSRKAAEEQYKELDAYNKELYKLNFRRASLEYGKEIQAYYERLPEFLKPHVLQTIPKKFHAALTSVDKALEEFLIEEEENDVKDVETIVTELEPEPQEQPKKKRKKKNEDANEPATSEMKTEPASPPKKKNRNEETNEMEGEVEEVPVQAERATSPKKKKKKQNVEGNTTEESDAGPVTENGASESEVAHVGAAPSKAPPNGRTLRKPKLSDFLPRRVMKNNDVHEIIRGIFDARQQIGRTYSAFYFYAKYVAREKLWIQTMKKLGLLETASRIFKTFIGLSNLQKMTFINESLSFFKSMDPSFWKKKGRVPKLHSFLYPGEPVPPPKTAYRLYQYEMAPVSRRYPELHIPKWQDLDEKVQNLYMKKLFRNTKTYVKAYEEFVMNMNPSDMVAYTVHNAELWEKHKLTKGSIRDAFRTFVFPLSRAELSEDENNEAEDSDPEVIDNMTLRARLNARANNRPEVHNVLNNEDLIAALTKRVRPEDPTFEEVMEDSSSGSDDPTESENEVTSFKYGDPLDKLKITTYVRRVKKLVRRRSRFLYDLSAIPDVVPEPDPESQQSGWTLKLLRKAQTTRGKNRIKRKYVYKDRVPVAAAAPNEEADTQDSESAVPPPVVASSPSQSFVSVDEGMLELPRIDPLIFGEQEPHSEESELTQFPSLTLVAPAPGDLDDKPEEKTEQKEYGQLSSIEVVSAGHDDQGKEQFFTVYHDIPVFDESDLE